MLLLPLVENAFKHGFGEKMPVIEVNCRSGADLFEFSVKNRKSKAVAVDIEASGIGLQNVRKRLEIGYPGLSVLRIDDSDNFYSALIKISF